MPFILQLKDSSSFGYNNFFYNFGFWFWFCSFVRWHLFWFYRSYSFACWHPILICLSWFCHFALLFVCTSFGSPTFARLLLVLLFLFFQCSLVHILVLLLLFLPLSTFLLVMLFLFLT